MLYFPFPELTSLVNYRGMQEELSKAEQQHIVPSPSDETIAEIASPPSHNTAYPTRKLSTAADWQDWLEAVREEVPGGFGGNIERASKLLAIQSGVISEAAEETTQAAGHFPVDLTTGLVIVDMKGLMGFDTEASKLAVLINRSALEVLSSFEDDATLTMTNIRDEVIFVGTAANFMRLGTLEELDHAEFHLFPPPEIYVGVQDTSLPAAIYHSSDLEYRAKIRQRDYAVTHNMPAETIAVLDNIILQASQTRLEKGAPVEASHMAYSI